MECLQYLRWWSERHKEQTFPTKKTTDKIHLRIIIIHQSILIHTNQYKFFNQISYQLIIYFFILEKMRQRKKISLRFCRLQTNRVIARILIASVIRVNGGDMIVNLWRNKEWWPQETLTDPRQMNPSTMIGYYWICICQINQKTAFLGRAVWCLAVKIFGMTRYYSAAFTQRCPAEFEWINCEQFEIWV